MNETEHHRSHPVRHFFRHFLEMVAAMVVAMFVLGGLVYLGFYLVGVDLFDIPPEVFLLGMAATMGIGMAAWMRHRQHEWPGILEMGGAMLASFIVLIPPYWLDAISVEAMFGLGARPHAAGNALGHDPPTSRLRPACEGRSGASRCKQLEGDVASFNHERDRQRLRERRTRSLK